MKHSALVLTFLREKISGPALKILFSVLTIGFHYLRAMFAAAVLYAIEAARFVTVRTSTGLRSALCRTDGGCDNDICGPDR
jgi:hypothetical protein